MAVPQLREIKNVRLSDQGADQIQLQIFDGHLQPGQKIPSEAELVKNFGVSCSTIREAFRTLESRRIIQV